MESQDSSSPIITRAVSAAHQGKFFQPYSFSAFQRFLLKQVGYLPQKVALWLIPRVQNPLALPPEQAASLQLNQLLSTRLEDYREAPAKVPSLTMGIGMGGTTAHLTMMMGGLFLPQAFVMTIQGGSVDGNVHTYVNRSRELALSLAKRIPEVMTIQHYDPIHDGWLTRSVNHLRLKLVQLPEVYKTFIRNRLEPGGEVCYLEGGAQWLRYRLGERSVFQVGGWGDISAEEFLQGSQRIMNYCRRERLRHTDWRLADVPLEEGPESEWGSEPGLCQELEAFCRENGYRFKKIHFDDPNDFSRLAFNAAAYRLQKAGIEPQATLVEMFSQFSATAVETSPILPIWLIFPTHDSLSFLKEMLNHAPADKTLFFSGLSTFSITPDLVASEEWRQAMEKFQVVSIGTRWTHNPADTHALIDWQKPLREWCAERPMQKLPRLDLEEISRLAERINPHSS